MEGPGQTALWLAVVASGLYHGLSPGMGWPLAVSAALWEKRDSALFRALIPIACGHFAAMAIVLLPFAFIAWFAKHGVAIRLASGLFIVAFGLWRLIDRRHPRILARIKPTQLALWSLLMATAHGAGLLLLPIYLGMSAHDAHAAHGAHAMPDELQSAILVAAVHTLAMLAAGGALAWLVYRYFGLQFLKKSWFNLEAVWALSLVVAGMAGVWSSLR